MFELYYQYMVASAWLRSGKVLLCFTVSRGYIQATDFVCLVFCKRCVPGHKEEGKLEADSVFFSVFNPANPSVEHETNPT